MSEGVRQVRIDIRRVLFRFFVPSDLYQVFLKTIDQDPRSKSSNPALDPAWILHNHSKDASGQFVVKTHNGECAIEVLVRPTAQGELRDFIQDLAHAHQLAFIDGT